MPFPVFTTEKLLILCDI